MTSKTTARLLAEYRASAYAHGHATTSRKRNYMYDRIMRLRLELRPRGSEYQQGILGLLDDEDQDVRVWACGDALAFAPERAVSVLREIAQQPTGMASLNAEMLLQQWEAGEWKMNP